MKINGVNCVAGLRAALEAPDDKRDDVFNELVMEPLRPMWEPMVKYNPYFASKADGSNLVEVGRAFAFYVPGDGVDEGLAAVQMLEEAGTWEACREALERAVAALRPGEHGVHIEEELLSLIVMSREQAAKNERSKGYTGWGAQPGFAIVMAWPNSYNVPRLPAALSHEFNHNVRFSIEPFNPVNTTVGQYIVAEGLAEAFSGELYGFDKVGPWASGLTADELATSRARIAEAVEVTGFNEIRGYIFGDWSAEEMGHAAHGLPDFAGYAVGYHLVRAYMERTGRSAAEATYLPWREIIEESRYLS